MNPRWMRRRSHSRRLAGGRSTSVRECLVLQSAETSRRNNSYRHPCPHCGASIISVRMLNGGWVHFEGTRGLTTIKHPCLHTGENLSKKRCIDTLDLF